MKKIILNFEKRRENFQELIQEAFDNNIFEFVVSEETILAFEDKFSITGYTRDPSLKTNNLIITRKEFVENSFPNVESEQKIGLYIQLQDKKDEEFIISNKNIMDFIIIKARDWKVIPFENIITHFQDAKSQIVAEVQNVEEAELMFKVLETGVDAILFKPTKVNQISDLTKLISENYKIELNEAEIVKIQQVSESERVCVDTSSLLNPGEGMLIGSTSKGFVLVHAEVFDTEFVPSRPFRVNAGDVSAYILVPSTQPEEYRTKYLSELKGGDQVFICNTKGFLKRVNVARIKIETRPMLRFELISKVNNIEFNLSIICQNAETIRLVDIEGNPKSIVNIKKGDKVLVHIGPGATHFGTPLNEKIIEK